MQELVLTALKTYGPFAAISIYFIWQTRKDYSGVCKRLNEVEDWQKSVLCDILVKTSRVIERNVEAMTKCTGKKPTQEDKDNANLRVQASKWTGG